MKNRFIDRIDDAIIEAVAYGDADFLDSFLEAEGYDLEEISKISTKIHKQQSFLIKGMINRTNDVQLLEKISNYFSDAINKNLEKPVNYLRGLIENNNLSVQYRNLDKLGVEDIKTIIKDQNLLELLERFENEK